MQRQIQKPLHEVFNDGFLTYGRDATKRIEGKRVGGQFTPEGTLAYKELSAREEDYRMADFMNASLDLKVKTMYPPPFRNISKTELKCVINNAKYDVIDVDRDADKRYLYFYLQKVGVVKNE
jgi:hypothetical protein